MKLYDISNSEKNNFSCVYMWTNLVNGKRYVGQTQCFGRRMAQYRCGRFNIAMGKDFDKYGADNFDIVVLERDIPLDALDERERYWINYHTTYDESRGYNVRRRSVTRRGYKHTQEWCDKRSAWLKDKWATDEEYRKFWSDKMSGENNYFYGKKLCGDKNGHATKVRCVELDKVYTTVKEASEKTGTSRQNISHALNGRQETAGGYHWEYV